MEQDNNTWSIVGGTVGGVLLLLWIVLILVSGWKMYAKSGQPGWTSLIPILNVLALLKIVHKPWWWLLLMLIPFVNIVIYVLIYNELSKAFGHGLGFTLLLIILTPIAQLILGFSDSETYRLQRDPIF